MILNSVSYKRHRIYLQIKQSYSLIADDMFNAGRCWKMWVGEGYVNRNVDATWPLNIEQLRKFRTYICIVMNVWGTLILVLNRELDCMAHLHWYCSLLKRLQFVCVWYTRSVISLQEGLIKGPTLLPNYNSFEWKYV